MAPLAAGSLGDAARVLARAFRDNPLNVAVIGPDAERRLRCNRAGMGVHLPAVARLATVLGAFRDEVLAGVLVAAAPGDHPLPGPSLLDQLPLLWRQGPRVVRRWGAVAERLRMSPPPADGFVLASLGVEPSLWGSGLGRALVLSWLRSVDASGGRAYLDTDRRENVPFYGGAGFHVAREIEILGVPVFQMERPPASLR